MPDTLRDELQGLLGGSYAIERELGGGGMSRVFVAREEALARRVVVKVLPPEMAAGVSIERFKREVLFAASLQHPHIVPLLAAGGNRELSYFTMPFVDGETLRARLSRQGELPVAEAVRLLREIASALAYAHERGVVHRDVKPENVLLSAGTAMVTDFGVAKAVSDSASTSNGGTSVGIALGTPAYMSPEQAAAEPNIDQRADIYSFGVLAYEILAGQPPFAGRTMQGMLAAHVTEMPEPVSQRRSSLPPALASLVMRCLEKRPSDRPQSAAAIVQQLDALSTPTVGTPPYAAATTSVRRGRPGRLILAAAIVVVAAVVGSFVWSARGKSEGGGIAVLPFENASGDTSMAFFADGMTDELATALSRAGAHVAARASVASVAVKKATDQDASKLLGVRLLLHGSVRRVGQRLRVWTQLVKGRDGQALWTQTFDTTLTDVFHVQDELARAIVKELQPNLAAETVVAESRSARGTTSFEAYEQAMRGRWYIDRFNADRAVAALQNAVRADPKYGRAYADLSRAYQLAAMSSIASRDSIWALSRDAATRALELDPSAATPHAAMGASLAAQWRFGEAEAEFKRGLSLEPNYPDLHLDYAAMLFEAGRLDEALAEAKRARELDPLSVSSIVLEQYTLEMLGRFDEARGATRAGLEIDPTSVALYQNAGIVEAFAGRPDSALALLKRAYDLDPKLFGNAAMLLFGYAVAGRWKEADSLRAQIEREGGGNSPDFFGAVIALTKGDRPTASHAIARGLELGEPLFYFVSAPCDPMFGLVKEEAEYRAALQRYGMRPCSPVGRWPIPARPSTH